MKKLILLLAITLTSTLASAQLDSKLGGLQVDTEHSNTSDLEPASKKVIDDFVKANPGGGGMPIVDPRTSYVAANKRFCISGDCKVLREKLANSWFVTAGAFKMSDLSDKVNVHIEGAPFRSSLRGVNFDFAIDKANVIDAERKTIYPQCSEDACVSFKIHAAGRGDAMLLQFIKAGGKKKYVLFINTSTSSEADAGYEFKLMDDYYAKKGKSLDAEGQALDPKGKEEEEAGERSPAAAAAKEDQNEDDTE